MNLYRMTEVLIILSNGNVISNKKLAEELQTTVDAVKWDVRHLKQLGYNIKRIGGSNGGNKYIGPEFKNTESIIIDTFLSTRDFNYEKKEL